MTLKVDDCLFNKQRIGVQILGWQMKLLKKYYRNKAKLTTELLRVFEEYKEIQWSNKMSLT